MRRIRQRAISEGFTPSLFGKLLGQGGFRLVDLQADISDLERHGGLTTDRAGRAGCLSLMIQNAQEASGPKQIRVMSSAWAMAGGELADVLQDGAAHRLGAAGRVGDALEQAAVVARVVKLFAGAAGVGDAVGIDQDHVAGVRG